MNKIRFWSILFILSTCLIACQNQEIEIPKTISPCVEKVLEEGNYTPYEGQEFDCCTGFLYLYELNGKEYFIYNNCCADVTFEPMDCDGLIDCENVSDEACSSDFFEQANYVGIIGFQE